eukprot:CAMPEP_0116997822 /NCGR_PEP_ID=MMETSP0472-20121206/1122_1 /TAXON_ID=693140 ORGANISM="Tiarina fusus, Strain LIS" /NCGR_SAMPLE_ID=MMETSP0472 /ASSEMBLY_ACC=CAM_ASM_000603 /LENGTH=61 /DNA_ID=CAMNT_0004696815 /DNA_START=342 /DNA_END=527 /DNA_ORIENTATION=-
MVGLERVEIRRAEDSEAGSSQMAPSAAALDPLFASSAVGSSRSIRWEDEAADPLLPRDADA